MLTETSSPSININKERIWIKVNIIENQSDLKFNGKYQNLRNIILL